MADRRTPPLLPHLLPQLLQQAVQLHQQGQWQAADALYQQVLQIDEKQFDALHLSGVIAKQLGDAPRAVKLIRQALNIDAQHAAAHCNLGAALQDLQQHEDALASFDRAIAINPAYGLAHNNRGNALCHLQRHAEAIDAYQTATQLRPNDPEAWRNLGKTLLHQGAYEDALACLDEALQLQPQHAETLCHRASSLHKLRMLQDALTDVDQALQLQADLLAAHITRGAILHALQRYDDAVASYDHALQRQPNNSIAHLNRAHALRAAGHRSEAITAYRLAHESGADVDTVNYALAALGAADASPNTAPAQYVRQLFDDYAEHFDAHLVEQLSYQTPQLLVDALSPLLPSRPLTIVDLGCGTGLCGPLLSRFSQRLIGVDLSQKMLAKAQQRGVYQQLMCADILDYLQSGDAEIDLLIAADVFVYLGDVAPVLQQAKRRLVRHGLLAFSVEHTDQADYLLQASQRYAHSFAYLQRLAAQYNFQIEISQSHNLRREHEHMVRGQLIVMRSV